MEIPRSAIPRNQGWAWVPLIIAVLVAAALSIASYLDWNLYLRVRADLRQSRAIVVDVGAVLLSLSDAETAERGFLLTARDEYLEPYSSAVRELPSQLSALQRDAAGEDDARVKQLQALAARKLEEIKTAIDLRRTSGLAKSVENIQTNRGKELMDQIRRVCEQIDDAAQARLVREQGFVEQSALFMRAISVAGGVILAALLVLTTITIRRRNHQVDQSEARYRQLADTMPQIVFTANQNGEPEYFNQRWNKIADKSATTNWTDLVFAEDAARCKGAWAESLASKKPLEVECRLSANGTGNPKWYLARAVFVTGDSPDSGRWFGTLTGIEHQKRIEDELRRANEDLRQFAYAASHDLQEPLRMISIYAEMLIDHVPREHGKDLALYENFIRQGVRRMAELLQDLLAYTKIHSESERSLTSVNTGAVVEKVLSNLGTKIEETSAVIEIGSLPVVAGQEAHFIQLFQNLIGNALKYRGVQTPHIELGAERIDARWRFFVKDNGIGIAPEYRQRVFGIFKRLHGSEIPGTGMGLSICQRVVERYGGTIWVEANECGGSVFQFEIPAYPSGRNGEGQTSSPPH